MIGMEDEDAVHRPLYCGMDLVFLSRNAEGHAQEVARIAERVRRLHERLADRIFVGPGCDGGHLGNQPVAGNLAMLRIGNIRAVVIEGRQRAHHAAHDRHRMRIATEALVELPELIVQHRVIGDCIGELVELVLFGQLAIQQEIRDLHEIRIFGQLPDRVTAMQQHALVTVDIGKRAFARGSGFVARIEGEGPGLAVQLADINDIRAGAPLHHGEFMGIAPNCELRLLVRQVRSPCAIQFQCGRSVSQLPARLSARGFPPGPGVPKHRKSPARLLAP